MEGCVVDCPFSNPISSDEMTSVLFLFRQLTPQESMKACFKDGCERCEGILEKIELEIR